MIAIPNIEKPKSCDGCLFAYMDGDLERNEWLTTWSCLLTDEPLVGDIRKDCPLIDIVTCGECKWGDTGIDEEGKLFWKCLGIHYGGTRPTDFCSYGERRE